LLDVLAFALAVCDTCLATRSKWSSVLADYRATRRTAAALFASLPQALLQAYIFASLGSGAAVFDGAAEAGGAHASDVTDTDRALYAHAAILPLSIGFSLLALLHAWTETLSDANARC